MMYLFKGNNDKELEIVNTQLETIKAKLTPIELAILTHNIKQELAGKNKKK
jgi:hypothetical protein